MNRADKNWAHFYKILDEYMPNLFKKSWTVSNLEGGTFGDPQTGLAGNNNQRCKTQLYHL